MQHLLRFLYIQNTALKVLTSTHREYISCHRKEISPMHMSFEEVVRFHGHTCPGLAIGYRMATAAMQALDALRSEDEEIVAIVETDSCGADAVQCVTGCTFGKGNLLFRDYGKLVYTFYARTSRKGVRVVFNRGAVTEDMREDRAAFIRWVLEAPAETIVRLMDVVVDEPETAKIHRSLACDVCGEYVMETRLQEIGGKLLCIPCAQQRG
jgi:formylmethanofuran dehydrogenase subunit E